jgi:hypothetical protein
MNEIKRMQQIAGIINENFEEAVGKEKKAVGPLLSAINPRPSGEVKKAVQELETYLVGTGAELDYTELAYLIIDIINEAKNDSDY